MASSPSVFPREFGDEILLQIFADVPPEDNLQSLQLVCRKFYNVGSDQTIWKRNCITSFRYWKDSRRFQNLVAGDKADVDWKEMWLARRRTNTRIGNLFDGILATKVGRLHRFRDICQFGYDAKDFLLEQLGTPDEADDVLARRYFAMSILDSLHRGVSIDVWSRLHDTENPPSIDQAFGAFDMFVVHEQPNDLDHISRWLDDAATSFQQTQESWHHAPTRTKALALVRWLRDQGFRGIQLEEDYRNLRNCFIGHVLSDPEHQSLPLVQAAIYVAVANRLGLDAACCNAPAHIHVVVSAPAGVDLDNNPLPEDSSTDRMYLDPYTSALELQSSDLEDRRQLLLHASPIPVSSAAFFDPSPLPPLVVRMASNIRHTYTLAKRLPQDSPTALSLKSLRAGDPEQNVELALYAALWSTLLSSPPQSPDWDAGLEFFLNRFALYYSEDSWIVERYLVPLYDRFVSRPANNNLEAGAARHRVGWENVREILRMLENLDARQPAVNRRYTAEIGRRVPYRIGQVFRHRRYGYIGVINGWAAAGLASLPTPHYVVDEEGDGDDAAADHDDGGAAARRDEWGATPAVRGPGRTYYTCLRPSCDRLRLAQDTIEIVTDPDLIPKQLFFLAGKFFKRFDRETCTFVSNIKEFYPDD